VSALRALAQKIANEPVVHVAGTIQAVLIWFFTYVATDWDPTKHEQQIAGLASAGAWAIAFIARQFVTPNSKVAAVATGGAGQANAGAGDVDDIPAGPLDPAAVPPAA
jgi:hypothetical protein